MDKTGEDELDASLVQKHLDNYQNASKEAFKSGPLHLDHVNSHRLSSAALKQLDEIYTEAGRETFLKLFSEAIVADRGNCNMADFFNMLTGNNELSPDPKSDTQLATAKRLEEEYYLAVVDFSRRYLASIAHEVPINSVVKFMSFGVGNGELSKELVERMKFSPDAPLKFREQALKGGWAHLTPKTDATSIKNDVIVEDKPWYEVRMTEEENIQEELDKVELMSISQAAVSGRHHDDARSFQEASKIYLNLGVRLFLLRNTSPPGKLIQHRGQDIPSHICFQRAMLCSLASDNDFNTPSLLGDIQRLTSEKRDDNKDPNFYPSHHMGFLLKLLNCIHNNDLGGFDHEVRQYYPDNVNDDNVEHWPDPWTTKMLLKIKSRFLPA